MIRRILGRMLAQLVLRLLEPRNGERFDRARSRLIDELRSRLEDR